MPESFSKYFFAGKWGKTIIILTMSQNQNMGANGILKDRVSPKFRSLALINRTCYSRYLSN